MPSLKEYLEQKDWKNVIDIVSARISVVNVTKASFMDLFALGFAHVQLGHAGQGERFLLQCQDLKDPVPDDTQLLKLYNTLAKLYLTEQRCVKYTCASSCP